MNLTEILDTSAEAADLLPQDQAALELARVYASHIMRADRTHDSRTVGDLGAKLAALLTALGMTQAGRAVKTKIEGGAANHDSNTAASTFEALRASFN